MPPVVSILWWISICMENQKSYNWVYIFFQKCLCNYRFLFEYFLSSVNQQKYSKYVLFEPWRLIEPVLISCFCSTKRTGGTHPQDKMLVYHWILSLELLSTPLAHGWGEGKDDRLSFKPHTFRSIGRRSNQPLDNPAPSTKI